MPKAVQELTDIDGDEREGAEVIADEVLSEEDWAAQVEGEQALDAVVASRMAELRSEIKAEILHELAAAQIAAQSKPSLAMRANVHDRFITGSNSPGGAAKILKHFRCDNAKSVKVIELDMKLLREYESGEKERPTNEKGRPYSAISLAVIPGSTIDWVDGHCYCYTDNQVANIERLQDLAARGASGGMPGIYEDVGSAEEWRCFTCQDNPLFTSRQTFDNHMAATHGVTVTRIAA